MGNMYLLAASSSKSGGSSFTFLIVIVLFIGVFYFLLMRPQRNRQRRVQETQNAITPGQRIRTTAGIYGTVVAVEDQDLILEIAPDVEVRVLRRAVMDVLPGNVYEDGTEDDEDAGTGEADADNAGDTEDAAEGGDAEGRAGSDGLLDAHSDGAHSDTAHANGAHPDAGTDEADDHDGETEPDADHAAGGTRARDK